MQTVAFAGVPFKGHMVRSPDAFITPGDKYRALDDQSKGPTDTPINPVCSKRANCKSGTMAHIDTLRQYRVPVLPVSESLDGWLAIMDTLLPTPWAFVQVFTSMMCEYHPHVLPQTLLHTLAIHLGEYFCNLCAVTIPGHGWNSLLFAEGEERQTPLGNFLLHEKYPVLLDSVRYLMLSFCRSLQCADAETLRNLLFIDPNVYIKEHVSPNDVDMTFLNVDTAKRLDTKVSAKQDTELWAFITKYVCSQLRYFVHYFNTTYWM